MTLDANIFMNGTILTMDIHDTVVEAIGVVGDRIATVGSMTYVQAQMPKDAQIIDLQGKTMIPAFIDPHGHFPDSGFVSELRANLAPPPRGNCSSLADVFKQLSEKADKTPVGEWVMGASYDDTSVKEGRMPTRDELDAVSTEHPIWVIHSSGHCGVANSIALATQGITEDAKNPLGGVYFRDENGRLNGQMNGLTAMGEMADTHFLINQERFMRGFDAARTEYLSYGVTLAQNAWTALPLLEMFAEVAAQGDPGIDLLLLPLSEDEPEFSSTGLGTQWPDQRHISLGPRKLLTDGSFLMRTAYLTEPYYTGSEGAEPDCGLPYMDRQVLFDEVKKLHDMGYQIHTHCNGDASADMFLDAVEAALASNPRSDHRHTLIHGQVMRRDQLDRVAELGITISFFTAHIYYWGDKHYSDFLGPDRAQNISPAGWAEDAGVRYTIHNDASVTPTRPMHLIHCAVNRKTSSGRVLGPDQKVSVSSALRAHTIDAAWQVFMEKDRGSIEPKKFADLVILDTNPLKNTESLDQIRVLQTWRRGDCVYRSD
jgi:predicted amidohydrolase YtcJ